MTHELSTPPATHRVASRLLREPGRPAWVRNNPNGWWFAVVTVCFGAFMGQLDASVVTLIYTPLQQAFGSSLAGVQWVSLVYLLVLAALLVPLGRMSDAYGRKLFYLAGFAVFTLASVACGLAWSLGALLIFRVVQAVGAGLLQANSVALVATSAPRGKVRRALGVQAGAQALGLALGPTVGGLLVSTIGWRWVFGINLPVGIAGVAAGWFLLPRTRQRSSRTQLDWVGVGTLAATTTGLLLFLSLESGLRWPGWAVVAVVLATLLAGAGLVARQRRSPDPLLPPALLRSVVMRRGLLVALAGYLVLFGPLVILPILAHATGASPLTAGLVLTALPAGFAAGALTGDHWMPGAWGNQRRCRVGAAGGLLALLLMIVGAAGPLTGSLPLIAPLLALLGLGLGVFIPANNAQVMQAASATTSGTTGGMLNMARGLGTALGVALMTLGWHLTDGPTHPALGLAVAGGILAVITLASLLLTPRSAPTYPRGHR